MIDAWRNLDGAYALRISGNLHEGVYPDRHDPATGRTIRQLGGRWVVDNGPFEGHWEVPESAVDRLEALRVFVVVLGGYCCTPPSGAEARVRDVDRRKVFRVRCKTCGRRPDSGTLWEVPIVEVCGEGEEGRLTFDAAFRGEVEPL